MLSNFSLNNNLSLENQETGLLLDPTLPEKNKENMVDSMKKLVIYQKNDIKWEDLVEMEEIEEGEILEDRSRSLLLEETQNVYFQSLEIQNVDTQPLEAPLCKEIVPFRNGSEVEERCLKGKDLKQKESQMKKN